MMKVTITKQEETTHLIYLLIRVLGISPDDAISIVHNSQSNGEWMVRYLEGLRVLRGFWN